MFKSFRGFSVNSFDFFMSSCPKPIYSINLCTVSHFRRYSVGDVIHDTTFKLNSMIQIIAIKRRNGLCLFSVFLKIVRQMKFEWRLTAYIRIVVNITMKLIITTFCVCLSSSSVKWTKFALNALKGDWMWKHLVPIFSIIFIIIRESLE